MKHPLELRTSETVLLPFIVNQIVNANDNPDVTPMSLRFTIL